MPNHAYGYRPSKPDHRDYLYRRLAPLAALPPSVDLRDITSPVRDQGQLGSCTGFAIAVGLREFLEGATPPPPNPEPVGCWQTIVNWLSGLFKVNAMADAFTEMSPLWLYYKEREIEGSIYWDAGAEPRDGLKVLQKQGCSPESEWPYNISRYTLKPTAVADEAALSFTITEYHRLSTLADVKDCLANGGGVVLGFNVYTSFEYIGADGKMPMPGDRETLLGGHAVFCVGYVDDSAWPGGGYLIVKNSWGTGWGDSGYFYMPYAFVTPVEVSDMWTASM